MPLITLLMTAATVALAGIGGLYYSYACSVMPGLRAVDDATFVRAMPRINTAIQNPTFGLSFVGAFFALAGVAAYSWVSGLASALPASVALACYTITLAITFGRISPLITPWPGLPTPAMPALAGNPLKAVGPNGIFTAPGCQWLPWWRLALHGLRFDSTIALASPRHGISLSGLFVVCGELSSCR